MLKDTRREIRPTDYDIVRIKLASPETIVNEWSHGEVTKPDTLNYRTLKPEKDGLFCERIFGPERDYECACGKYKKKRFQNTVCDRCNVLVTTSRVRRTRMGHIALAVPIAHIWFVKSAPSKIGTLLDMTVKDLERILYYESFIVIDPGDSPYEKYELIEVDEYYEIRDKVGDNFIAMMGAEAVRELLSRIDLHNEALNIRSRLKMEKDMLIQQSQLYHSQKAMYELEMRTISIENEALNTKLNARRKEFMDIALNINEQRLFLEKLSATVNEINNTSEEVKRSEMLKDMALQIRQRMSFSRETKEFYMRVEDIHKDFHLKLKSSYPNLTEFENRLAGLLRLNLSTKEMAALLNISPKSVEVARYRLKKKLQLNKDQALHDFINNL